MHDIAEFAGRHPPFDSLDPETLENVAASAEIEFYAAGRAILESAAATAEFAYRFPEHAILPVLERPAAVRFVVRSLARTSVCSRGRTRPPCPRPAAAACAT